MSLASTHSATRFAYRYGNPMVEVDGARMRAQCRQLATVVTVSGDIAAANVDRVAQQVTRFVLTEKPFVLDLGDVARFSTHGMALLRAVDEACRGAVVQWCLIASEPVSNVLRGLGGPVDCSTAGSVAEALGYFRDALNERRRLLPMLNKTA